MWLVRRPFGRKKLPSARTADIARASMKGRINFRRIANSTAHTAEHRSSGDRSLFRPFHSSFSSASIRPFCFRVRGASSGGQWRR